MTSNILSLRVIKGVFKITFTSFDSSGEILFATVPGIAVWSIFVAGPAGAIICIFGLSWGLGALLLKGVPEVC